MFSEMVFHKSIDRFLVEFGGGVGKSDDFEERWSKIENRKKIDDIDTSFFTSDVRLEDFKGMKVYYVNDTGQNDVVLFYIHGGYYVKQASEAQMKAIEKIVRATDCMVVIPDYPLAPEFTVDDSFDKMIELYELVWQDNQDKKICLMGDSAGGGYSLVLAESLADYGIDQPNELILLSPWVDLSMNNPKIQEYVASDPILTMKMCHASANAWRGNRDTNDWHVSPIYGDMSELKRVTIFVGTMEIFYPDNALLYDQLVSYGNKDVTLHVGEGMSHVYPIYYTETGKSALNDIIDIMKK